MKIIISEASRSTIWESRKTGAVGIAKESRSRLPLENIHFSMKMSLSEASRSTIWESRKTGAVGIAKESRSRLPLENTHISMKMHEYAASSAITCSKYLLETLAGNTCLKQT